MKSVLLFLKRVSYVVAAVIVLTAILSLVFRWGLIRIDDYRDEIIAALEDATGARVAIGRLEASLRGLNLSVKAADLKLASPAGEDDGIAVAEAIIGIDGLASLFNMEWALESVYLSQAKLKAATDRDRNLLLPDIGLAIPLQAPLYGLTAHGDMARRLHTRIRVDGLDVEWSSPLHPQALHFEDISLVIDKESADAYIALDASLPRQFGKHIRISVGDDGVYLRAEMLELANVLAEAGMTSPLDGRLSAELAWQADEAEHKLGIFNLRLQSPSLTLENAKASVMQRKRADGKFQTVLHFDLGEDARIDAQRMQALRDAAAKHIGEIATEVGLIETAAVTAKFEHDTSLFALPGRESSWSESVSDTLQWEHLTAVKSDLALERVILTENSRLLDRVVLQAGLHRSRDDMVLDINKAELYAGGAVLKGNARIDGKDMSHITTQFRLEDMPVTDALDWLPADAPLFPQAQSGLRETFQGGEIKRAEVYFDGALSLPVKLSENRFRMQAEAEGISVLYAKEQPPLHDVDATITASNEMFEARVRSFRSLGATGRNASVVIRDITDPYLEAKATLHAPLQDVFAYLETLPDLFATRDTLDGIQAAGDTWIALDLGLPLAEPAEQPLLFSLTFDLDKNALTFDESFPQIQDIEGRLVIAHDDARAENIGATLAGHPIVLSAHVKNDDLVFAAAAESLPASVLSQLASIPPDLLDGVSDWRAELVLSSLYSQTDTEDETISFRAASNLQGLALRLPRPFGKSHAQAADFRFATDLSDTDGRTSIAYAELARLDFLSEASPPVGTLRFSPQLPYPAAPIPADGFGIRGTIQEAHLSEWREWRDERRALFRDSKSGGRGDDTSHLFDNIDVTAEQTTLADNRFGELKVRTDRDSNNNLVMEIASEPIAGRITFPSSDAARTYVDMQRLHIDHPIADTATEDTPDPREIAPMAVKINSFRFENIRLDNLKMSVDSNKEGIDIPRLDFEHIHKDHVILRARLKGSWTREGGADRSDFKFEAKGSDYGRLLRNWGYNTSLRDGKGQARGHLRWDAPAYAIDIEKMNGAASFDIKDGRVKALEVGAGKLLGLLNIGALARRFTLDFKDIFDKGFSFDEFGGNIEFNEGNMLTDDIVIKGPSLDMIISGRTGIATRDYDQSIDVVPDFSSNLPLATALLGGPIAGALVFLVDTVTDLGDEFDEAIVMRYTLKGSWEDPQVDFVEAPTINRLNPGERLKGLFDSVGEGIKKVMPAGDEDN